MAKALTISLALTILFIFILISCKLKPGMTNDQIISETKKCHDAGMDARTVTNDLTYETILVVCSPKENK
jgi:hypothetical protein